MAAMSSTGLLPVRRYRSEAAWRTRLGSVSATLIVVWCVRRSRAVLAPRVSGLPHSRPWRGPARLDLTPNAPGQAA